ncbi:MAG TPA: GlsB/YeaQ/YmgE family stress response membrane protein [Acidimicrobiia bacterium]|nr:GlsB/YeaQ/YmgE family stress response membrane protein [Acidimicrobiia bacterium]
MGLIGFLLILVLGGAVVGGLGRLALPGPDPMTLGQTIAVGIAGSLLAGLVVRVLSGGEYGAGLLASVLGATLVVWLVRRSRENRTGA